MQTESLDSLGRLVDMILEEGPIELAQSPAKLRVVMMVLAHPKLADPSEEPSVPPKNGEYRAQKIRQRKLMSFWIVLFVNGLLCFNGFLLFPNG